MSPIRIFYLTFYFQTECLLIYDIVAITYYINFKRWLWRRIKRSYFCWNDSSNVTSKGGFSKKTWRTVSGFRWYYNISSHFLIARKNPDVSFFDGIFEKFYSLLTFLGGFRGLLHSGVWRLIACPPLTMRFWSEPPICFQAVFATVLFNACLANFFSVATSTNSVAPCTKIFWSNFFAGLYKFSCQC